MILAGGLELERSLRVTSGQGEPRNCRPARELFSFRPDYAPDPGIWPKIDGGNWGEMPEQSNVTLAGSWASLHGVRVPELHRREGEGQGRATGTARAQIRQPPLFRHPAVSQSPSRGRAVRVLTILASIIDSAEFWVGRGTLRANAGMGNAKHRERVDEVIVQARRDAYRWSH